MIVFCRLQISLLSFSTNFVIPCFKTHWSLISVDPGTIQSPILYAIYVSPLFDLLKLANFADDNFIIKWSNSMMNLIRDIENDLKIMIKWLKD